MFIIPEDFVTFTIARCGEEGRAWLNRLPSVLTNCMERWNLTIGTPVDNLSFSYVAPGVLANGTEVVLKTGMTDEFPSQPQALRHFDGHGMVRLLAYDEQDAIMLLERLKPGMSLRTIKDEESAISIATDVMRKLWHPLPQIHYSFPTIHDWGRGFARLRQLYNGGTGPFPYVIFDKAEKLYAELSASMGEQVLLHGDLHQDNILSAKRETWLAIDPKGLIGEPAYETGALLRNFWPDILSVPNPKSLMTHRIDLLSTKLGFDRKRIYSWGFSQAVLSVLWSVEDTGKLADEALYFVELLDTIKI